MPNKATSNQLLESTIGIVNSFCAQPAVPTTNLSECATAGLALGGQKVFEASNLLFSVARELDVPADLEKSPPCPFPDDVYLSCTYVPATQKCTCKSRTYGVSSEATGSPMNALMLYRYGAVRGSHLVWTFSDTHTHARVDEVWSRSK